MSIAEKLTTIAENIPKVYDKGYSNGYNEGYSKGVADGGNSSSYDEAFADGYDKGYTDGEIESGGYLWQYARDLDALFSGVTFPDNTKINLYVENPSGLKMICRTSNIDEFKISGNVNGNKLDVTQGFFVCENLKIIDFSDFNAIFSGISLAFGNCTKLVEIKGNIDLSSSANNMGFGGCSALVDVRFVANSIKLSISFSHSSLLSSDSINSIIDGLADLTGSDTQTISFHSSVLDSMSEEQANTIIAKNWAIN